MVMLSSYIGDGATFLNASDVLIFYLVHIGPSGFRGRG